MDLYNDPSLNNSPGWEIQLVANSEMSSRIPKGGQIGYSNFWVRNAYTGREIKITAPSVTLAIAHAFLIDCGEPRKVVSSERINNQIIDHRYVVRCGNWFADERELIQM